MKKSVVAGIAFLPLLTVSAAMAANGDQLPASNSTWDGLYVGGEASGIIGTSHRDFSNGPIGTGDYTVGGAMGGATLGYNQQRGPIVIGLESDISGGNASGKYVKGHDNYYVDSNWLATLRPRIGYSICNFLPYVTGGLAAGDVHAGASNNITGYHYLNYTEAQLGWTAGAGVETAIAPQLSVKVEYLYVDLGNTDATNDVGVHSVTKFDENVVRVGLNYAFR